MKLLVTGGAGFIGSALIRHMIAETERSVVNVDKLTYSGNLKSISMVSKSDRYTFEQADICDRNHMKQIFREHQPDRVIHLAAESHVDRSIDDPEAFMQTNIIGTYRLLEIAKNYWSELEDKKRKSQFCFQHVSTDEVFGDLDGIDDLFTENSPYQPSSPYSASKASSDHLVRSWFRTFGLPTIITNCSNNYGPYQFPEKLIPTIISNALNGIALPIYGKGTQIRDWLYVDDHARALLRVADAGIPGQTYNVGGVNEMQNIAVVEAICALLEELAPNKPNNVVNYRDLITHVTDRPGHDQRYAIDINKIRTELNWQPAETFDTGLKKTVQWYLCNQNWCTRVQDGSYLGQRLGLDLGGER